MSLSQWKLLGLLLLLSAPVPVAWAMWHWQLGIPAGVGVSAEVQPDVPLLADWLPAYHQPDADFYLLVNCQGLSCPAERIWRIHRALGKDAKRIWRWRFDSNSNNALPGETITKNTVADDSPLLLADADGRIVLRFQQLDDKQVLRDLRYVLKRAPAAPDYWPEQQDD